MQSALTWLGAALLVLVFVWAALAKLVRYSSWRDALAAYGFEGWRQGVAAPAVPLAEATTAALIALVSLKAGAALSLALLGAFSLALLRARSRSGDRLPCGCFGRTKARDYRLMLLRNGFLVVLAAMVLLSSEREGLLFGMEAPSPGEILPAALGVIGLGILGLVVWQAGTVLSNQTKTAPDNTETRSPAA